MTDQPTPRTEADTGRRSIERWLAQWGIHNDGEILGLLDGWRDAIEAQARTDALDVEAAIHTMQRAGLSQVWAQSLAPLVLAAALTGERHDLDDEYLTPEQRERLRILRDFEATR